METAFRLAEKFPAGVVRVAESGIHSADDVARLRAAGYHAFLVGESLMRAESPGEALRELLVRVAQSESSGARVVVPGEAQLVLAVSKILVMTWVKICGMTNLEDALVAVDAGADAVGFVFYEKSPRCVTVETAREIVEKLPESVEKVGVFVGGFGSMRVRLEAGLTGRSRMFRQISSRAQRKYEGDWDGPAAVTRKVPDGVSDESLW